MLVGNEAVPAEVPVLWLSQVDISASVIGTADTSGQSGVRVFSLSRTHARTHTLRMHCVDVAAEFTGELCVTNSLRCSRRAVEVLSAITTQFLKSVLCQVYGMFYQHSYKY
jgi:hypothetical protein